MKKDKKIMIVGAVMLLIAIIAIVSIAKTPFNEQLCPDGAFCDVSLSVVSPTQAQLDARDEVLLPEKVLGEFGERQSTTALLSFIESTEAEIGSAGFSRISSRHLNYQPIAYGYKADATYTPICYTSYTGSEGVIRKGTCENYAYPYGYVEIRMGVACNVGDYVVVRIEDEGFTNNRLAFAHFWYKSDLNDIIYARDFWLKDFKGHIDYECWKGPTIEYDYTCAGSGTLLEGTQYIGDCPSDVCSISQYTSSDKLSLSEAQDILCKDIQYVTCYQCQGRTLVDEVFENTCDSGWTTYKPNCAPSTVICYQCNSGQIVTQTFTGSCGTGWSSTQLSSCTVTCYRCEGSEVISQQQEGCLPGWALVPPSSCEEPQVPCYKCSEGVIISEFFTSCTGEWSSTQPSACEPPQPGFIEWLKENPGLAAGIAAGAIVFLFLVFMLLRPPKNSGGVAL